MLDKYKDNIKVNNLEEHNFTLKQYYYSELGLVDDEGALVLLIFKPDKSDIEITIVNKYNIVIDGTGEVETITNGSSRQDMYTFEVYGNINLGLYVDPHAVYIYNNARVYTDYGIKTKAFLYDEAKLKANGSEAIVKAYDNSLIDFEAEAVVVDLELYDNTIATTTNATVEKVNAYNNSKIYIKRFTSIKTKPGITLHNNAQAFYDYD